MNREHVTAQAITALYREGGHPLRATSVAWRGRTLAEAPPRWSRGRSRQTTGYLREGSDPGEEAGTRQFDRSEVRRVRASRPDIREGWPPHERTVYDGTAIQSGSGSGSPQPRHGQGAAQRGDPERGERRGTPRPPGRGGAPGVMGPGREPRGRVLQGKRRVTGVSPELEQPSLAEPGSRRPRRTRRDASPDPRAGQREGEAPIDTSGCRVANRPDRGEESVSTTTSVRMERLSRSRPGTTWGAPASEAARPIPHRKRDEDQQRRLRSPRPELAPSRGTPGSPGEPRWSEDFGPETRCPGRQSGREPVKAARCRRAAQCNPTVEQARGSPERREP